MLLCFLFYQNQCTFQLNFMEEFNSTFDTLPPWFPHQCPDRFCKRDQSSTHFVSVTFKNSFQKCENINAKLSRTDDAPPFTHSAGVKVYAVTLR